MTIAMVNINNNSDDDDNANKNCINGHDTIVDETAASTAAATRKQHQQ